MGCRNRQSRESAIQGHKGRQLCRILKCIVSGSDDRTVHTYSSDIPNSDPKSKSYCMQPTSDKRKGLTKTGNLNPLYFIIFKFNMAVLSLAFRNLKKKKRTSACVYFFNFSKIWFRVAIRLVFFPHQQTVRSPIVSKNTHPFVFFF